MPMLFNLQLNRLMVGKRAQPISHTETHLYVMDNLVRNGGLELEGMEVCLSGVVMASLQGAEVYMVLCRGCTVHVHVFTCLPQ